LFLPLVKKKVYCYFEKAMVVQVVPLGAGQDVGRSCVLVSVGGKNVMFDCGMHMGYNDERRFPDFNYISKDNRFTELIDAVVITHLYGSFFFLF